MSNRLQYFDVLKGIAIFLVVMGHVLTMCIRDIDSAFSFKIIGEIHMPIFFFISGFFSYKAIETKTFVSPKLMQRFLQLIVPFIVVSALWVWYFPHSQLDSPLSAQFRSLYADTWKNGYWFTLCLFEIILIYAGLCFIFRRTKNFAMQIIISICAWIFLGILTFYLLPEQICGILSLTLVFQFFPIFMVGVLASSNRHYFLYVTSKSWIYTICLIVTCLTIYYLCYYWEFPDIPSGFIYIIRCIMHIALSCIAITVIKRRTENSSISSRPISIISYLGKESLSIYLLHYFFLFPIGMLQYPLRDMGLGFVPTITIAAIIAAIIISMVLIVNYIISHSKLFSLLLTGRIKSNI